MQIHKTQIEILRLGSSDYAETWAAMKQYTHLRDAHSPDQLWITEHPPIYTQGLNGRSEHVLDRGDIPLLQVDRGGQVTYHGPGQLVIYCLLDLSRLGLGVKALVTRIENSVIELLGNHGVAAHARAGAPGVYVAQAKVAALGLRIRKGCCYHGLSLNVGMDLEPFTRIDPCGYPGLAVTQLRDLGIDREIRQIGDELAAIMRKNLAPA